MTLATRPRTRRTVANAAAQRGAAPDPVTQYALDVTEGRIVAGQLVRRACQRHLDDLRTGAERGLFFDVASASRAISFFPMVLRHYKGRWGPDPLHGRPLGEPVTLQGWQQFVVGAAMGWKRTDGLRRFRHVYVEVGAKNGKTLMAAGVALLLSFFDGEAGAEGYSVATKRDQAKLVWNDAARMVKASPALKRRIDSLALNLSDPNTASFFRPLGADSDTDQGINVHATIIDELHVIKDRDLVDNIEKAAGARSQPQIWKITTAGVKRESVWAEDRADAVAVLEGRATDDSLFAAIYTLDPDDDPFDEAVWPKANPNLGVSIDIAFLRERAAVAKRSPGKMNGYLRYHMNKPTQQSTKAIAIEEWDRNNAEPQAGPGSIGYEGLDLASVRDLTALVLLFRADDGFYDVVCRFWCPEDGIDERSRVDGVPYRQWVDEGFLIPTPGNITDYSFIRAEQLHLAETYQVPEIGYDRWNATQLVTELISDGANCIPIPQTSAGLGPAWRELMKVILDHKLRHGGHPILRWMAGNVEVETDAQGNERPSKARSSERIDGMVALTMAMARSMANGEPVVWSAA